MTESKTFAIYREFKKEIVALKYDANEPINEKDVAEKYNVSKTPAREALNMLVQDGYLRKYPRLGYFINEVSESEYYKLLYLRFTLEKGVIAHIIKNCRDEDIERLYELCKDTEVSYKDYVSVNNRFHIGMASITGNEYLVNAVENVFDRILRRPSPTLYKKFSQTPHAGHKELIQALLDRDIERAIAILRVECRRDDDIALWF